jgi:predicted aldo/keto reductase-like oxidoreductase
LKYRAFGRLDWQVSALGFGAMRMPVIGGDRSIIDEPEAIRMIRYAIDHGVNYLDTGYPYHGGNSEILVGKALQHGYRAKVKLATKMPSWLITSQEDMTRIFEEQLTKLQTTFVDFYLLHGLRKPRWPTLLNNKVFDWAEHEMRSGRIKYLGFSFHDDYPLFKEIIDAYDGWTLCQIQYNYIDTDYQAGTQGLKYAASKGVAVVVMEPLQGGILALTPPHAIQHVWNQAKSNRTLVDWALQWLWNQPEVSVVLSGMSTMRQVTENIASADRSGINTLSEKEIRLVAQVRKKYLEVGYVGCTGCRYCVPCPEDVAIPEILAFYNEHHMQRGDAETQKDIINRYFGTIADENRADNCISCGACEEQCPQQLPIRNLIAQAARRFRKS